MLILYTYVSKFNVILQIIFYFYFSPYTHPLWNKDINKGEIFFFSITTWLPFLASLSKLPGFRLSFHGFQLLKQSTNLHWALPEPLPPHVFAGLNDEYNWSLSSPLRPEAWCWASWQRLLRVVATSMYHGTGISAKTTWPTYQVLTSGNLRSS